MSTELPDKTSEKRKLTFTVPHILKSISIDEDGFYHREVREGGPRQIEFEHTQEFSDTAVENEPLFSIRSTNQLNFAGIGINVINDEVEWPNGFRLVPTSPTKSEYLEKVGTKVQTSLLCSRHKHLSEKHGKDIFHIARAYITSLP